MNWNGDKDEPVQNLARSQPPGLGKSDNELAETVGSIFVEEKQARHESKEFPVQNLAQESEQAVRLSDRWEDETQTATRRANSLPPQQSVTTAIVHQEQSPWLSTNVTKEDVSSDVVDERRMPSRARSMNVKTGGNPMKTDVRVLDDSNVKYNWTESITESCLETQLDAGRSDDVTGRPGASSSVGTAAGGTDRQYAGGENSGSPPSEGPSQGDYQQPLSLASDQPSSCDQSVPRGEGRLGEDKDSCRAAAAIGDPSDQCYNANDGPFYVNVSALAADAAGEDDVEEKDWNKSKSKHENWKDGDVDAAGDDAGDAAGSDDYMQVFDYNADDDVDNIYLSLLDIISVEERQIEVSKQSNARL